MISSNVNTLTEIFYAQTTGALRDKTYLLYKPERGKPYMSMTYDTFGKRAIETAMSLHALGLRRGDRIAILSESRPEWMMTDFAALLLGAITVPMFPTLTPKQVEYILINSGARMVVVSNDLQFRKVMKSLPECPDLKEIFVCARSEAIPREGGTANIHMFEEIALQASSAEIDVRIEADKAKADDVVTLIYTSGTTGTPKGVMLTHRNLTSNIRGALAMLPEITPDDVFLSFLPLSHSFERIASYFKFYTGASVAYAESLDTVAENMLEVQPTIMTGVPRFYERIHTRIMKARDKMTPTKQRLFDWAHEIGKANGSKYEGLHVSLRAKVLYPLADRLVLKKIRERTGGRVRFLVSGAAPLSKEVGRAFAGFGIQIIEGYGMTEASPVISVNPFTKVKWGTVGQAIPNVRVKIAQDGEILALGPNVMKGYYNLPDDTREAIDSEGWLHTGDIGEIDSEGYISITDRKKHLFISSGGKNIAPAHIEASLLESKFLEQVMLIGDKRQFNTAILVPNFENVREYFTAKGLAMPTEDKDLVLAKSVRELIEKELEASQINLASYERVRRFALLAEPFSVENGMMTPTLKIRRKEVEKRYEELIESLYKVARA
jgi:long-chain acyl-CoA synthetase